MHKNKDFKLKLIFPCKFEYYIPFSHTPINYPPYGMGVITAFLRKQGYYVEQEDLSATFNRYNNRFLPFIFIKNADFDIIRNEDEIDDFLRSGLTKGKLSLLIDRILNFTSIEGFDAVGFSIFSVFHFIFALVLAKRIKQRADVPIVFGGPFISFWGRLYPEVFDYVDYMIVGDGSIPLLKLINHLNNKITISEVPNLIYRDNGKLIINPRQHYPIEDMPMPDFDGLPMELYKIRGLKGHFFLPYQTSRGCTNRCSFCPNIRINDKLEFKSYDKIINDLKQMKERHKSGNFHFCDDAINNSYEYLEGFCNIFIKHKLNINWSVYAKVGNLDKHILKKMKEAGCYLLIFGIESGSGNILRSMHKGFTAEEASRTLRDASEVGLKNFINLIAGYPYETQEDIEQTVDFIRKNRKYIYYTTIYRFSLTYTSLIYNNPEKYGVTNLTPLKPRFCFAFDETRGLKWEDKQKQQEDSERQIIKAVHKNAGFKRKIELLFLYCIKFFAQIIAKIKKLCLSI